jgi:hypothetical protein
MKKSLFLFAAAVWLTALGAYSQDTKPPVRFAMVGLNHDHAMSFIPRLAGRTDVQLVGIVETNQDLIGVIPGDFISIQIYFIQASKRFLPKQMCKPWQPSLPRLIMRGWWKYAPRMAWT